MKEKKEQRIIDRPTPGQIKAVLEKAKKIAQEKEKKSPAASAPDKMDLVLEQISGLITRQTRLEELYNKGVVLPTGSQSSEKKTTGQERQSNEELLAEAQAEQQKAAGQEQPGQPGQQQAQLTPEQYQALPAEKKVPILEAQVKAQQGQQQNVGKLTGQQALYGLIETIKAAVPAIQTAIAKGGSNGNPLDSFLSQMKIYEGIEQGALSRFFNYMKMLSPGQREAKMDKLDTSAPIQRSNEGRIKG